MKKQINNDLIDMTAEERDIATRGQSGQGEHLTGAKGRAK